MAIKTGDTIEASNALQILGSDETTVALLRHINSLTQRYNNFDTFGDTSKTDTGNTTANVNDQTAGQVELTLTEYTTPVTNPSFETAIGAEWVYEEDFTQMTDGGRTSNNPSDGSWSYRISGPNKGGNGGVTGEYARIKQNVDLTDVKNVIFDYYATNGGGTNAYSIRSWIDGAAQSFTDNPATGSYTVTIDVSSFTGTHDLQIGMQHNNFSTWSAGDDSLIADFDNVRFERYDSSNTFRSLDLAGGTSNTIKKVVVTSNETTPTDTSITWYASADGASNWEAITVDKIHEFTNTGTDLRVRADLASTSRDTTSSIQDYAIMWKEEL